jgi:hypothetical protein
MNYQPQFKTLREVLEEAQCRHVVTVVRSSRTLEEAAATLDVCLQHLRKLRRRYGLKIRPKNNQNI